MTQNRWKSPVLWAAVGAQLLAVLVLLKVIDLQTSDLITGVIAGILEVLTLLGVLNNPTSKDTP